MSIDINKNALHERTLIQMAFYICSNKTVNSMRNEYLRFFFYKKLSKYSTDIRYINHTFDELLKAYNADKRYYHNLNHIISLLKLFENYKDALMEDETVFMSIWFHDSVYDAWRSDNEEESAEWARQFLTKIDFPNLKVEKVARYILATKTHEANSRDTDMAYFLDFDLAILSAEETIYDVYTQQIRDEYSFYPSFLYNRGRRKVLQNLLDKPTIYHTPTFQNRNSLARANIERELARL